jgi:MATE family multidrug resistance protein
MLVTWLAFLTIDSWGLHADIRGLAGPYLRAIASGALPLLLYASFRRYLQGLHVVRPIMIALITANVVNAVANWALIYGNAGMPALGVEGSAWATSLARLYMAAFLFVAVRREHRRRGDQHPRVPVGLQRARMRELAALGAPAASQITLEVGVFALVTALAARLDPIASASHQIALNIASVVFMVPLGISAAAAVMVGQHIGRRDPHGAARAGWAAILLVLGVQASAALAFVVIPAYFVRAFTSETAVIAIGVQLLGIASAFQLFDGLQVTTTGALRGLGETRVPMLVSLVGYWISGLPLGWWLCFRGGYGVHGLWIGLAASLALVGTALLVLWRVRIGQAARAQAPVVVTA